MLFESFLSPQQLQVIEALSEGATTTDAAAHAGVHRNTVANWRRNLLPFREAFADAQYDRAIFYREQAEALTDLAFETLRNILTDPKASPSVRLKAALFVVEKSITPPVPQKRITLEIQKISIPPAPPATDPNANIHDSVHKNAQSADAPAAPQSPAAPETAPTAPQTIRRDAPKVGRNEPCPCGSGQKYKRCCLNKPQTSPRATAA